MEENLSEEENKEKCLTSEEPKITKNKYKLFLSLSLLLTLIASSIIIILYLYLSNEKSEKENNEECLRYDSDKKCIKCNSYYELINNTCKPTFSFKALYQNEKNISQDLINRKYRNTILKLIVDDQDKDIATSYLFNTTGNHTIYMLLNITKMEKIEEMFSGISSLVSINFTYLFDTKNIISFRKMFYDCKKLSYINISLFNTHNITDLAYLFSGCSSLKSIDLSNFIIDNLKIMVGIFNGCSSLTSIDLSHFKTEKVTHINNLFNGCYSLTSIDLSNFNTENVIYMEYLFNGCVNLTSIDLSNFNTKNVKYMECMFNGCKNLKYLDISHFSNISNPRSYSGFCSFISSSGGIIKVSKNFVENIAKYIPNTWEIILVDN